MPPCDLISSLLRAALRWTSGRRRGRSDGPATRITRYHDTDINQLCRKFESSFVGTRTGVTLSPQRNRKVRSGVALRASKFHHNAAQKNVRLRRRGTMIFRMTNTTHECAQCGEQLSEPEWSERIGQRSVRHLWKCEGCDYAFETTVSYAAAAA